MRTTCGCMPFFVLLLSSAQFGVVSAALPPSAEVSKNSILISEEGIIIQQQNSTPLSPTPLLNTLNATLTSPNTTVSIPSIFPIPGTNMFLEITYIGPSWFATSLLEALFTSAHQKIKEAVSWRPDERVAPLPWFHSLYNKQWRDTIAIRIRVNQGKTFTWLQLEWVLGGLLGFMEGKPLQLHPVNFDVNVVDQGVVAAGLLWYSQSPPPRYGGGEI